jgi:hypothetical protein
MKEVLSLIMFGIGALCFAMFIAVVNPTAVTAFPGQGSQPGHCGAEASPTLACRL